jgi:hypothetical protein
MPYGCVYMQAGVNACGKREGNHIYIVYSYDIYEGNIVQKKRISFGFGGLIIYLLQ